MGDINPDWNGGLSNTLRYGNLSLNFLVITSYSIHYTKLYEMRCMLNQIFLMKMVLKYLSWKSSLLKWTDGMPRVMQQTY